MQNETSLKEYSTVHNAIITLGDTDDSGKGRHFKSRFIQPGVAGYPGQFGNVLITKESLDKFIDTMVGVPVIINHKNLNNKNVDDERVGVVNSVWYDNKDGWYWCDGIIWDETAQNLITDKNWSVSCSYDVKTADNKGGSENNIKYDMEFLDGVFTHLALVNNPRYERANIVFNSKDAITEQFTDIFFEALAEVIVENGFGKSVNNDRWITIHPHGEDSDDYRRIKLEDGETPKEAIDRVYKKEDKKEKSEEELKKEKKQLYQDILKAKADGNKELHHKLLERYYEVDSLLKGNKSEQVSKKESKSGNGLLPAYASEFFDKKKKRDEARERWHKLLAEYQEKAKDDPKFQEFDKQVQEIYNKMREHSRYDFSFQELVNQKNEILDQKHAYEREFYKEVYAAQEEYSNADTSIDKKDIIQQMSGDIKKQLNKISSNNNELISKLNKIDSSENDSLRKLDTEYDQKQNELVAKMRELPYLDPERTALRNQYADIAAKRGEIIKKQRELQYKTALQVGKILQVENGVKLNTKCSAQMQDITDKLKSCLDGVIPSDNFNNAEMTVKGHSGRAFQSGSTIHISKNGKIETAIHETMHHLEEHSEHVLMNSLAFASSRTEGEKQESLKRLTGLNYKANEVCKKDRFFNPYCGKLYDVFGGRNKNFINSNASEIMSMGVQELFTNPKEFAKNDREYFDFVVANLQGKLWD